MARKQFCGAACRESYHADRRAGLIYGGFGVPRARVPDGMPFQVLAGTLLVMVGWEQGCQIYDECRYCRANLHVEVNHA
jgi:hypothetical protein